MNIDDYSLPNTLSGYLKSSKTIKVKLNDSILEAIEDNYIRLKQFYEFNEEEFGEISVDCLTRYKSVESFGFFLNQNLQEKATLTIKGNEKNSEFISKVLDNQFRFAKSEMLKSMVAYKPLEENEHYDFYNTVDFHRVHSICNFIIEIKKELGLPHEKLRSEFEEIDTQKFVDLTSRESYKYDDNYDGLLEAYYRGEDDITELLKQLKAKTDSSTGPGIRKLVEIHGN